VNATSTPGGLDTFEGERPRLTGLAYRITCSLADAEDVVQEVWIRWASQDATTVDDPAVWLTTVTSRLALDRLRAQRRRREVYVGPWLPDPVPTARDVGETAGLISDAGPAWRAARHPVADAERVRQRLKGSWRLMALKTRSSPDERPPHAFLRSTRALRSCWTRPRGRS
jgi:DNA-directed RNA polymerase specialized sigma24 family protein